MSAYPLEPTREEMESMVAGAARVVIDHIEGLGDAPAVQLERADALVQALREAAPEAGGTFDDLLARGVEAFEESFNTAGPGYLAFIPGGGLFTSALAEFVSRSLNRFGAYWFPSPPLAQMEATVIRWLCDIVGYPESARGILTTGGSMANFSATVAARHTILGEQFTDGVVYVTEHTHASAAKGARLAGFPTSAIRPVGIDDQLRMDVHALRQAITSDRAAGLRPAMIMASAGTTNTGAIDPLPELGEIARAEGMWLHADGAYGGAFAMTERGRERLVGLDAADSITLDPHKTMFLPYGTGALLVREGNLLRDSHTPPGPTHYLADLAGGEEIINLADYSAELSRESRGFRLWLPIMLHGLSAFRDALDEKLDLAAHLHDALAAMPELVLPWDTQLTTVAFRVKDSDGQRGDARTKELLERINATKRVFMSSTVIEGRTIIRACVVSHRTHQDRIDEAVEIVRREVALV